MSSFVLDSCALLAVLGKEKDAAEIVDHCHNSFISTINLAEVFSKAAEFGISIELMSWAVSQMQIIPVAPDVEHAKIIGAYREPTRALGLSIGDRACLALGFLKQLPVLTSDQQLCKAELGVEVISFRAHR